MAAVITGLIIFVFAVSIAVGLWAIWMLADWIAHGCPDRFKTDA